MGKKKKFNKGFMPMFPVIPLPFMFPMFPMPPKAWGGEDEAENEDKEAEKTKKKDNIKSTVKSVWMQNIDMKKSSADNGKEQWKQFFDYLMEMQETFAASLPDELPALPNGQKIPFSPKGFFEQLKEFQEMANEHFMEQADSVADFRIKRQQKLYDAVSSAMDKSGKATDEQDTDDDQND